MRTRLTLLQRLAVIFPLSLLALTAGTLIVIACNPDIDKPASQVVILPAPAPKSLMVWLEYEYTANEQAAYAFRKPYRDPPQRTIWFYAGSVTPENLIAERSAGTLRWGPMALDTPYEVVWRGLGEIHVRGDVKQAETDLHRLEPDALIRLVE